MLQTSIIPPKPRCKSAFRRGVTLCETVVVVLILGLIGSIAMPRFSNSLSQQRAVTLARHIAMDVESTRREARASSTSKSITFDTVNKTYTLNGVKNPNRQSASFTVSLTDYVSGAAYGNTDLGGDATLVFNGFGFPDSGGSIQVKVGSVTKTIVIDAMSGSTTIQ